MRMRASYLMALFIVTHPVEDYEEWREVHDAAAAAGIHDEYGVEILHIIQSLEDPGDVTIVGRGETESIQTFLNSDDLKEAMEDAGVAGPLEVTVGVDRK